MISFVSRRNTLRMILNAPLMLPDAMVLVLLGDALGEVRGTSIKRWMMMRTRCFTCRVRPRQCVWHCSHP